MCTNSVTVCARTNFTYLSTHPLIFVHLLCISGAHKWGQGSRRSHFSRLGVYLLEKHPIWACCHHLKCQCGRGTKASMNSFVFNQILDKVYHRTWRQAFSPMWRQFNDPNELQLRKFYCPFFPQRLKTPLRRATHQISTHNSEAPSKGYVHWLPSHCMYMDSATARLIFFWKRGKKGTIFLLINYHLVFLKILQPSSHVNLFIHSFYCWDSYFLWTLNWNHTLKPGFCTGNTTHLCRNDHVCTTINRLWWNLIKLSLQKYLRA